MKRAPALLALALLAFPLMVSAEAPPARVMPVGSLQFGGVWTHRGDAPREDQDRVAGTVDSSLRQGHHRVRRCLADSRVRLDGRYFGQRLEGSVTFNRSERPTQVRIAPRGLPPAVEQCVSEVARTLYVRPAPRGSVELRFAYSVR